MRKTLIATLLAISLPAAALANPFGHHGPRGGDHGPRPFHELNLTKEQQREIAKLMGDEMKNQRKITKRYLDKLPESEKKAMEKDLQENREKTQKGIRALLNADQQKAFDEHLKKLEEKRAERAEFEAWKAEKAKKAQ
ncbi:Spy/CpxP family protein refolding chaperone [Zestomonas thermotolerans]|uniref:Spy/CpxP family protein refolding chaperone n=1 Tax=Zestomonas thermotolerans TaxID=157784 RepID=UPI0023EF8A79|nr:LTXXQ domain protein [Pseudomonas thermotolerans]MBO2510052.1 LTXXQ domain protein [Gammaproteobacteria bacterium]